MVVVAILAQGTHWSVAHAQVLMVEFEYRIIANDDVEARENVAGVAALQEHLNSLSTFDQSLRASPTGVVSESSDS